MSARCGIRPGQQGFEKARGTTPIAGEKRRNGGYAFDALVAVRGGFAAGFTIKAGDPKRGPGTKTTYMKNENETRREKERNDDADLDQNGR
jgi:hypothetical protein